MQIKSNRFFNKLVVLGLISLTGVLAGCSAGPQDVNREGEAKAVQTAQSARQIFDKYHGDWDKVSDADKAAYTQLAGSELNARASWAGMKQGPAAAQAIMRGGK
jgi:hypothetical protein